MSYVDVDLTIGYVEEDGRRACAPARGREGGALLRYVVRTAS